MFNQNKFKATEEFRETAFYMSSQGAEAMSNQTAQRQAAEEAEPATPFTYKSGKDLNMNMQSTRKINLREIKSTCR